MAQHLMHVRQFLMIVILCFLVGFPVSPEAQSTPVYVAVGDSIEFGLGDDILVDGIGYVDPFGSLLSSLFGPVEIHNFSEPFAQARDILRTQVPSALSAIQGRAPIVVSWGGGGNDLLAIGTGPQAAACRQSQSCLGRFAGLLNEVEQTIDATIARLREAVGPAGRIQMRTQYNGLIKSGCAPPDVVRLGNITLEGAPGTVLERGLRRSRADMTRRSSSCSCRLR